MGNLPIPGLPSLTATTNNSLLVVSASGTTYNISALNFWKSAQPFGTLYQNLIPDAPSAHTIGSLAYPIQAIFVSTGSVHIGGTKLTAPLQDVITANVAFASPLVQIGNVNSAGDIITTSGYSITDQLGDLIMVKNSNKLRYNISDQLIPTGGTATQVLTRGSGTYGWGWSALTPTQIPTRYYGSFTSNVTQINPVANTIRAMSADTTEISNGVILSANTRFVVQNAGIYNLQFSAQLQQLNNVNSTISIWFRKNGVDIPKTNTELGIDKEGGGLSKLVAAWNIVESFTANEYIEIMWSSADTGMEILWQNTQTVPVRPATPSLIVTVTQV